MSFFIGKGGKLYIVRECCVGICFNNDEVFFLEGVIIGGGRGSAFVPLMLNCIDTTK